MLQRRGWGRGSPLIQHPDLASGWPWGGLLSPAGHSPSLFPGLLKLTCWPKARWAGGHREKARICLITHSPPDDHHSPYHWLNPALMSLTDSWELLGGAHCTASQWLRGTCGLIIGCRVMAHSNSYVLRAALPELCYIMNIILPSLRDLGSLIKVSINVNPWLIHVNVWQKPLQYCKIISLQLIKLNEKKINKWSSLE